MMSILIVIFMYAVWSSIFSIGKVALQFSTPLFLTGSRMMVAGVLILGFLALKNRRAFIVPKKHFLPLILLGILSIYLTNVLEFWGLQYLTSAKTCFLYSLSPFLAALLSYIHFKETLNVKKIFGMVIGFLGFIPALVIQEGSSTLFSMTSWAELAVIGAVFFSIYGWVLLRLLVKNEEITPLFANGSSMVIGGLFALIHSFFVDVWQPLPIVENGMSGFLKNCGALLLISNIICYNLYGYMLKKFTATFLSFIGLLSPIFASITAWILIGEPPSWVIFLSTLIVGLGVFIIYQAELKQGYIKQKEAPLIKVN